MSSLTQQRRIVYAKQISKEQAIIIIIPARKWAEATGYNLCLDSGVFGIDGCVK